jgi:hypothetical protein
MPFPILNARFFMLYENELLSGFGLSWRPSGDCLSLSAQVHGSSLEALRAANSFSS